VARSPAAPTAAQTKSLIRSYLTALPPATRKRMRELRDTIRAAAPAAEEGFSYRIPGFRVGGRPLVWYAGWKEHCSMYPITPALLRALDVEGYDTSKGTIRFPLDRPLPRALVRRLVKARLGELTAEASARRRV
jgi:uncharacterized protein YdhG (YjbR/CyaY superfamily)